MIILHKIKFYTGINQFSLYLLYIPVHDLNTLYTMMCLLNAPISIRMRIVNKYNEVSCTQSLDHKLVQTMHSSFTITSLSLLKELSLSSTFISCATFTQTQWLLYIIDFHFFHFSACWKEVMGRPPCPHVPTPTLPLTASGVAKMLFLTLPLFVLEKVWKHVKQE